MSSPVRLKTRSKAPPAGLRFAAALASAAALVAVGLGACGSADSESQLTVFAAASLTDSFTELAQAFEAEHDGVEVRVSFAGSQSLRNQIEQGARPTIFASANRDHMEALETSGLVSEPVSFARNRLVIVVPPTNPANIRSLADLPRSQRLVMAGNTVPAGVYASRMLELANHEFGDHFAASVNARVVSRELHVRAVLQKVALGEADAGIVYATDAKSANAREPGRVLTIEIPTSFNVEAIYPVAQVMARRTDLGAAFVRFLRSPEGASVLARHGFAPTPALTASR